MPARIRVEHLGLALGQLGDQRFAAAKARRAQQHRRGDRGRALGDPGIGHLERRGGADRAVDDAPIDPPIAQHRGLPGRRTRGVDRRAVARPRRPADDPAIDKIGAGRRDDLADADRGLRADRVAVDIDRLSVERLQAPAPAGAPAPRPRRAAGSTERNRRPASNARSSAAGSMPAPCARARRSLRCAPTGACALRRRSRASRRPTPAPIIPCAMIAITAMPAASSHNSIAGQGIGRRLDGKSRAARVKPAVPVDPFLGPAADRRRVGAGLAPALAQCRDLVETHFPAGVEAMLQHAPHQRGETGALAVGRDRHGQVAAPKHRGRMKIAAPAIVLDIDQHTGGLRCRADFGRRRIGERRREKPAAPARSRPRAAAAAQPVPAADQGRARASGEAHRFRACRRRPRRAVPAGGRPLLRRRPGSPGAAPDRR